MIKLSYGELISPFPLMLPIGTIQKPTLKNIAEISFEKFSFIRSYLDLTPRSYFKSTINEEAKSYWNNLTDDKRNNMDIYDVILKYEDVCNGYMDTLNFFFSEQVVFRDEFFVILKDGHIQTEKISPDIVKGIITRETFSDIINLLKQICYMEIDEEEDIEQMKFKNALAKQLYLRMKEAEKEEKENKKVNKDLSIPNIVSKVVARHTSLNYTNIWDITLFQLIDVFNSMQNNELYNIVATSVSVWGNKDKKFKDSLWYENQYEK